MCMLPKAYDPKITEDAIYELWQTSGAFTPPKQATGEPFSIVMPPPNATGQLHLGHAVMLALEDIFSRYERMQGKDVLWLPGTDHAAIATENVVIQKLKKEGIKNPREHFGREELVDKIKEFVTESQGTIRGQITKMGSSCDWTRAAYTMDEVRSLVVQKVFAQMFTDGLIYRGHRIVNWDPNLQTNVSDDEVDRRDQTDPFYWFTYGPFTIGTVRPETKFGDKYVVVHPQDERYKDWNHGDTFEAEWINGTVTAMLIKDEVADPEFGTGAMTITPWHSLADFEIAQRHNLPMEQIIDFDGTLLPIAGEFAGMHIKDVREPLVAKLHAKGLVVKIEEKYGHAVAVNSRGGGIIEPQVKEQWFIDVNKPVNCWKGKWAGRTMSIKEVMQEAVRRGDEPGDKIDIIPERFTKTYFYWIDNLRDWCISRQIWWGHRIPVWYKDGETSVDPAKADEPGWEQDPDTLDTWFSSALWTWSTLLDETILEHPEQSLEEMLASSADFKRFHPTAVLETGYDILPFWVARMILMTTYATGDLPFKKVYLHGLIRDKNGAKMSKSKPETMIDPLDILPEYGADALRLAMIVGQSPGNDSRLSIEKIGGYRNFINKLWNASRYVLLQCESTGIDPSTIQSDDFTIESLADKALFQELFILRKDVTLGLDRYSLSEVGERLYSFTWDYFCDWYLELSKGELNPKFLLFAIRELLVLLHPYCPFVTEKLWSEFKYKDAPMLIQYSWPTPLDTLDDESSKLNKVIEVIKAVRSIRSEQGIEPIKKLSVTLYTAEADLLASQAEHVKRLARLESLHIVPEGPQLPEVASAFLQGTEVHVSLVGLIDKDAEQAKLEAEKSKLQGFIIGLEKKLANEQFVQNADASIVDREREKLASNQEKLAKITERLTGL